MSSSSLLQVVPAAGAFGVGAHLAVALLMLLRYADTRGRVVLWWAAAYTLLTAHAVADAIIGAAAPPAPAAAMHALRLAAALMLFGSFQAHRPLLRWGAAAALMAASASFLPGASGSVPPWSALPPALVAGALFVASAARYHRAQKRRRDPGTHLIVGGLALTGLLAVGSPFVRSLEWGGDLGTVLAGLFTLMLGAGAVLRSWSDTRELELLNAIAGALNRLTNVRESVQEALRLVGRLLGVESGWVFLRQGDGATLAASFGRAAQLVVNASPGESGDCHCLRMLAEDRLPPAANAVECQRMARAGIAHTRHATVPVRVGARTLGLMNLVLPGRRTFSERELQMVSTVGHQIGLAVERGSLFDEVAAKERARGELLDKLISAHEDERRRIARELHDEAGQALTALIVNLELAAQEESPERVRAHIVQLRDLAERTLAEIRRLIYDLRPSILDDLGLVAALRWYAKSLLDPRGISWSLTVSGLAGRLPPSMETVVFRLVQEALANVQRHSRATAVTVSLALAGRELRVRIEDNGQGFDVQRIRTAGSDGGFGLIGMRERVELVGGHWEAHSRPGAGTIITAALPLRDAGADQ